MWKCMRLWKRIPSIFDSFAKQCGSNQIQRTWAASSFVIRSITVLSSTHTRSRTHAHSQKVCTAILAQEKWLCINNIVVAHDSRYGKTTTIAAIKSSIHAIIVDQSKKSYIVVFVFLSSRFALCKYYIDKCDKRKRRSNESHIHVCIQKWTAYKTHSKWHSTKLRYKI